MHGETVKFVALEFHYVST